MADNKNQHFVPRVHFNPFSIRNEGKVIYLFNLDRMQIIFGAPLKNQCSQDYFYGRDSQLERAIQTVERGYGKCIASLHIPDAQIDAYHQIALRRFAYLQHVRTEAAARLSTEFAFAVASVKGSDIELPTFKEAMKHSIFLAMKHFAKTMNITDDLKLRIVRNHTSVPFITSDDPAVLANRWHQRSSRAKHRSFGMESAGLVLFLPLSPKFLAVLFDSDVYKIDHTSNWIDIYNATEIDACNDYQILNCNANLYFNTEDAGDRLQSRIRAIKHLRPPRRFEVFMAVPDGGTDTHTRYKVIQNPDLREHEEILTHVRSIRPISPSWPSFLKFRSRRIVYTNGTGAGFRRRSTAVSDSWDSPPWRRVQG